jgi:hypothetical protein
MLSPSPGSTYFIVALTLFGAYSPNVNEVVAASWWGSDADAEALQAHSDYYKDVLQHAWIDLGLFYCTK